MFKNSQILNTLNQNLWKNQSNQSNPKEYKKQNFIFSSSNPLSQIQAMFNKDSQFQANICQACKLDYIQKQVALKSSKSRELLQMKINEQQHEPQCNKTLIFQLKSQKFDTSKNCHIKNCRSQFPISMEELAQENFKICCQNKNKTQCQCQNIQKVLQNGLQKLKQLQKRKNQIQQSKKIIQKQCEKQMIENQKLRKNINQIKIKKQMSIAQIHKELQSIKSEIQSLSDEKDNYAQQKSDMLIKENNENKQQNAVFNKMTNLIYM